MRDLRFHLSNPLRDRTGKPRSVIFYCLPYSKTIFIHPLTNEWRDGLYEYNEEFFNQWFEFIICAGLAHEDIHIILDEICDPKISDQFDVLFPKPFDILKFMR